MTQPNENGFQRTASDMHNIQQDNDRIQQNTADGEPAAQLPPRPDPETGTPAPPKAPVQYPEGYNEKNPRFPSPPPGKGPALAVYRQKRIASWGGGFILVAVLMVAIVLYDGFEPLTRWQIWVIFAVGYFWTVFVHRVDTVSAGADWVRAGRKHWVNTYELTRIQIRTYGTNQPGLVLADQERAIEVDLGLLQYERKVWDYVHLGMLHSAANGADVDLRARAAFPQIADAAQNTNS